MLFVDYIKIQKIHIKKKICKSNFERPSPEHLAKTVDVNSFAILISYLTNMSRNHNSILMN